MKKSLFLIPAILLFASWIKFDGTTTGMVINLKFSSSKGMNGTVKISYDTPGTRIEMNASASSGYAFTRTSLVKKSEPDIVYTIDDKTKTYSTADVSRAETDQNTDPATATFIDTVTVNGYHCKHCKVVQGDKNWETWTTTAITEYAQMSAVMNKQKYIGNHGMHEALKAINAEGFPVKLIMTDKDGTTTTELVSAEHKTLDASLFTVPSDYTKGAASWPGGGNYPHAGGH